MKLIDYISEIILVVLLTGILVTSNMTTNPYPEEICKIDSEEDCIFPGDSVFFHTDNATFNVSGGLPFHNLTRTNDYMEFNNTKIYVNSIGVDITLDSLVDNTTVVTTDKLMSFYTNNTGWFNITGFLGDTQYSIYKNGTSSLKITSDASGTLSFQIIEITPRYIEIFISLEDWNDMESWLGFLHNSSNIIQIETLSGTLFNLTIGNWSERTSWNGYLYNITTWKDASEFNGSLYNISIFNLQDQWNGSIYNFTYGVWTSNSVWNGQIFNLSNSITVSEINGKLFNTSSINTIENWNGSVFSLVSFQTFKTWNGSLYNTSDFKSISTWNGSICNSSLGWIDVITTKGSLFNVSVFAQIKSINGSIYTEIIYTQVGEISGNIYNSSNWGDMDVWNGSLLGENQSWVIITTWSGSIYHTTLDINFTCVIQGSNVECTACKQGILDDYKWEIKPNEGTVGSTGWIDYVSGDEIKTSSSFSDEKIIDVFLYARNRYNESTKNSSSVFTTYNIPDLPPVPPDPNKKPYDPLDVQILPEAGEHKEDSTKLFNIEVHNFLIIIPILILFFFFVKGSIKWKRVKRNPAIWLKDKKPKRKRLPNGRTLVIQQKARKSKILKTKKIGGKEVIFKIHKKPKQIKKNINGREFIFRRK